MKRLGPKESKWGRFFFDGRCSFLRGQSLQKQMATALKQVKEGNCSPSSFGIADLMFFTPNDYFFLSLFRIVAISAKRSLRCDWVEASLAFGNAAKISVARFSKATLATARSSLVRRVGPAELDLRGGGPAGAGLVTSGGSNSLPKISK